MNALRQMSEDFSSISWHPQLEEYFKDTGEKAHGRSWLHKTSEQLYSTRRTWIDLPVIIGSGVIAFLNAGSSSLFSDPMMSSVSLGVGSLVLGVLNSVGTYYGWAKRAEGHRIAAIQYSRLYRFLRIEMGLPRSERMTPADLLKYVKDADDRLQEISPLVPQTVIADFRRRFHQKTNPNPIAMPEEANGLEAIVVFPRAEEGRAEETQPETPFVASRVFPPRLEEPASAGLPQTRPHPQSAEEVSVLGRVASSSAPASQTHTLEEHP
jgi:hypothetical protein